jgi:hypothetical protein
VFQFALAPARSTSGHRTDRGRAPRTARAVNATSSACADDAPAAWGNPQDGPNHVGITLIRSPVANRWRRARNACGRVDRLTPVGSRSDGPRPRFVRWPRMPRRAPALYTAQRSDRLAAAVSAAAITRDRKLDRRDSSRRFRSARSVQPRVIGGGACVSGRRSRQLLIAGATGGYERRSTSRRRDLGRSRSIRSVGYAWPCLRATKTNLCSQSSRSHLRTL